MPPDEVKTSEIPSGATVDSNTFLVGHSSTPTTERYQITDVQEYMFTPENIPANGANPITRDNELIFDHIASGCVWSADSAGVNRNASCTAGVVYINGQRLTVPSVTGRTFTASKDVYCGIKDDGNGSTASWVYYDNTTNTASPTLATIGNVDMLGAIIVVGASSIASTASLNQGELSKTLPIVSSVPMTFTDSQGDIIHPRDPQQRMIGYRQITSDFATASSSDVQITGMSCPVKVRSGDNVEVTAFGYKMSNSSSPTNTFLKIWEGSVGGTQVGEGDNTSGGANYTTPAIASRLYTPSSSSITYNASLNANGGGTSTLAAKSAAPAYLKVERR